MEAGRIPSSSYVLSSESLLNDFFFIDFYLFT